MNKKNVFPSTRTLRVSQDKGYACVYLDGKRIMLGARYGTPEAEEAFRQLQIKVLTDPALTFLNPQQVTVDILCCAYLKYAKEHDPGHYGSVKTAITILLQHFSGQPAGQKSISVTQGYNHADVKIAVEQALKRS